jgi:hypothetical protein
MAKAKRSTAPTVDPLTGFEHIRATQHGSRFGSRNIEQRDFGGGLVLPAIDLQGYNPMAITSQR